MRQILLTLCACFAFSSAYSQLTPAAYRDAVVAYSWDMKSAESVAAQAEDRVRYARVAMLPNLSAAGRYNYALRESAGSKDWSMSLEPQIIQTIYGGGVVRADIEQAELNSAAARCDVSYTLLEVNYAADYAYWNLWAMDRHYEAMREYVDLIESELRVIERRYNEGYIPKGDLLMIVSRLSEAEYTLTSTNKSREVARNNFNTLRGCDPAESVVLSKVSPDSMSVPIRVPIDQVIDSRPDYLSARLAEASAEAATRATRGAYNPQITGGINGSWRTHTPNISGSTYLDGAVYVALSVPIFHFGERRKAVAISQATQRQKEITTQSLYDTIRQDESNAWAAVVESRRHMSVAAHSLRVASENLQISTYSYNEGEVSIVELMQAQISWIQIYTNVIESEYSYQLALSAYRRVVGEM